jgi:hypothetical protein
MASGFQLKSIHLVLALSIALSAVPSSVAKSSPESLLDAIKQLNILHGEASITQSGSEASVSAYRAETATDKDCKIDAVMVAKTAFEKDPALTRVTVRFYDVRNSARYSEVSVTIGDVTAFGAGAISKDQLLSAMVIRNVGGESSGVPASVPTAASPSPGATGATSSTGGGTSAASSSGAGTSSGTSSDPTIAAATTSASSSLGVTETSAARSKARSSQDAFVGMGQYEAYGLKLRYPSRWKGQNPQGGNVLVRFLSEVPGRQPTIVELKVFAADKVSAAAVAQQTTEQTFHAMWSVAFEASLPDEMRLAMQAMRERFGQMRQRMSAEQSQMYAQRSRMHASRGWQTVRLSPVVIPGSIKIGASKSIAATQKAYWADAPMSARVYMRTVVFSSPHYVYQLSMLTPQTESALANTEFEQVLSSLTVASAAARPKSAK